MPFGTIYPAHHRATVHSEGNSFILEGATLRVELDENRANVRGSNADLMIDFLNMRRHFLQVLRAATKEGVEHR